MNLLKKITCADKLIFSLFFILHISLFGINVVEWGDSYRILRAANYIKSFTYPLDEKRPPLFSAILALQPNGVDAVVFGRIVVFAFSVLSFFIFKKIAQHFIKDKKYVNVALLFFVLNPVYLYWSIRIMADVPFAFFAMLVLYLFTIWSENKLLNVWRLLLLGALTSLAVLTRFEGYLLFAAICAGLFNFKFSLKNFKNIFIYGVGFASLVVPYLLYKNPFASSYLQEPTGRSYDFKMVSIYLISLLFIFGFTSAFYFIFNSYKLVWKFLITNLSISAFLALELVLILVWPAAIPRLFVCVIPFLTIILVLSMEHYFEKSTKPKPLYVLLINSLLFGAYVLGQYFLKLQFLIVLKPVFVIICILQAFIIWNIYLKNLKWFIVLVSISMLLWSITTIYIHKDIYRNIKEAALSVTGKDLIYNDIDSIVMWYGGSDSDFCDMNKKVDEVKKCIGKYDPDYLIVSNDHDIYYKFDGKKYQGLTLEKEFKELINGKIFYARVYKVQN